MAGLLAGRSVKGLAKDLGVSRSNVQQHRDRLLSDGYLVLSEGRFFPGPGRGGAMRRDNSHHAPVQGAITQGIAPPRLDVATDGKRVFRVTRPPAPGKAEQMPGFAGNKPKGRKPATQLLHKVEYVTGGRTWNIWLEEGLRTGKWTAWVGQVKPAPRFADFQKAGEDPDDAWDRLTIETMVEWSAKAGIGLEPVPRRARPVSVTYPGVVEGSSWRSQKSDADQTPPDPSGRLALEVRGKDMQEAVNALPETTEVVAAIQAEVSRQAGLLLDMARNVTAHVQVSANHAALLSSSAVTPPPGDGVTARPSPSFRPPSPWEFI